MPISLIHNSNLLDGTTCNWVVPQGVKSVKFEIWGGGGGGGSTADTCDCCAKGQGGSGGGYAVKTLQVSPGDTYAITVGAGGNISGLGSATTSCANGISGGKTYITGTGLTNFCAEGGLGGCSNVNNCYRTCGCNGPAGGMAYGGTLNMQGGDAFQGSSGSAASQSFSIGGNAAGPGGGVGGFNTGGFSNSTCNGSHASASGYNPYLKGVFPGGGGAGAGYMCCACCSMPGGAGAAGLVKITW